MQAQSAGVNVTGGGALTRLVAAARRRVSTKLVPLQSELKAAVGRAAKAPSFRASLEEGIDVGVIAELKRRSPSQGDLHDDLDVGRRSRDYAAGGAAALSVLTEETEFAGSLTDLALARASVPLPLLRKDFHVHPLQLYEAKIAGASAVLLIARALGAIGLKSMLNETRSLGLEALVEVHSGEELLWAIDLGAECVGINARDLETLAVDQRIVTDLLPRVPARMCAIAESGIASRADVERVARAGADAVLVGTALSRASDPVRTVRSLTGVRREERSAN